MNSFFGKKIVYQNVDLDDETLMSISEETNGKYFNATNTDELQNIYTQIDLLEKRKVKSFSHVKYRDFYPFPLFLGLILLLIESILRTTRWRVFHEFLEISIYMAVDNCSYFILNLGFVSSVENKTFRKFFSHQFKKTLIKKRMSWVQISFISISMFFSIVALMGPKLGHRWEKVETKRG